MKKILLTSVVLCSLVACGVPTSTTPPDSTDQTKGQDFDFNTRPLGADLETKTKDWRPFYNPLTGFTFRYPMDTFPRDQFYTLSVVSELPDTGTGMTKQAAHALQDYTQNARTGDVQESEEPAGYKVRTQKMQYGDFFGKYVQSYDTEHPGLKIEFFVYRKDRVLYFHATQSYNGDTSAAHHNEYLDKFVDGRLSDAEIQYLDTFDTILQTLRVVKDPNDPKMKLTPVGTKK